MIAQRWIRIIPAALMVYTISYVDRTNVSLAMDRRISTMLPDLAMDDRMKGAAAGIFFFGYLLMQVPGGYIAQRWSAKKFISLCLVGWGAAAICCGLVHTSGQFAASRFLLGFSESGVFPAMMVMIARWFPPGERVRATALFCMSQPLAVAVSAPITGWCLGAYGWRAMLIAEGALPMLWLPIWWFLVSDRPEDARWLSSEEGARIEVGMEKEMEIGEATTPIRLWQVLLRWEVILLVVICMVIAGYSYGCMTFFTSSLRNRQFTGLEYGLLFSVPYLAAIPLMMFISWHSDLKRERRGHVALLLGISGICLILNVVANDHFWLSYAFICLAIPGPFAALAPFFVIPAEIFPKKFLGPLIGTVNAIGGLGGFFGPYFVGSLTNVYHSVSVPFILLGIAMFAAGAFALLLPNSKRFGI